MIKITLSVLAFSSLTPLPATVIAAPIAVAPALDDHPDPPFLTTPECEAAARLWARHHSGQTDVWHWAYVWEYTHYIEERCPRLD